MAQLPCPRCNTETRVNDSRPSANPVPSVRRRRECSVCKHRFTTYEFEIAKYGAFLVERMSNKGVRVTPVELEEVTVAKTRITPSGTGDGCSDD